jgi:Homing endonuclease associated repeat
MKFEFKRYRIDKLSPEKALKALEKAAQLFNYNEFGKREFNNAHVGVSSSGISNTFGSWAAGMEELRKSLGEQGREIIPKNPNVISDQSLFSEMERIWIFLGHCPSRYEWENSSPVFGYNTYRRRFGGWQEACLQFIEFQMGGKLEIDQINRPVNIPVPNESALTKIVHDRKRDPSAGLRLHVLDRDGFRCVLCARSPADDRRVKLHIDHIVPFSNGNHLYCFQSDRPTT